MRKRSKIIRSRDKWKRKTVQRAGEIREHRKTQRRYRQEIAQLKVEIWALEQTVEVKKNEVELAATGNLVDLAEAQQVRTLCVLLVLQAVDGQIARRRRGD